MRFLSFQKFNKKRNPVDDNNSFSKEYVSWLLVLMFLLFFIGNNQFKAPFYFIFLVAYFGMAFFSLKPVFQLSLTVKSLVPLLGVFLASYFWSFVPRLTFDVIQSQIIFIVFALCVSARHRFGGFSNSLQKASIIIVGLVVLFCLVFPSASYTSSGLTAFYIHKNMLGGIMAVCALTLFNAPKQNKFYIWIGFLAVCLLIATLSKTSITLFFSCMIFVQVAKYIGGGAYKIQQPLTIKEFCISTIFVVALILLVLMVIFRDEILGIVWDNLPKTALTGRGMLWLVIIQQIRSYSLLGIGPGVFWQGGGASQIAQTTLYQKDPYWVQRMGSADGGYIDLVASLGVLGLAFFFLTAIDFYRRLRLHWQQPDSHLLFVLVTFVLIHAVTESTILQSTNVFWLLYLLCYFRVCSYSAFSSKSVQKISMKSKC